MLLGRLHELSAVCDAQMGVNFANPATKCCCESTLHALFFQAAPEQRPIGASFGFTFARFPKGLVACEIEQVFVEVLFNVTHNICAGCWIVLGCLSEYIAGTYRRLSSELIELNGLRVLPPRSFGIFYNTHNKVVDRFSN